MIWKCCELWKILWELASRYGMYGHKSLINIHELFGKKVKTVQIQIAISHGLTGIFACGFLRYGPWNNAFKAVMKKQKYKSLSFEL